MLRPQRLDDFTGQERMKANLSILIEAARARQEPLDHVLFHGPPGLGKTTLAHIIAGAMGARIHCTSGPQLEKAGDLAGIGATIAAPGEVGGAAQAAPGDDEPASRLVGFARVTGIGLPRRRFGADERRRSG